MSTTIKAADRYGSAENGNALIVECKVCKEEACRECLAPYR